MDEQLMSMLLSISIVVLILILAFISIFSFWNKLEEIKSLLYSRYVQFDPKIDKIVDLAVDYWRLKKHLEKIRATLTSDDTKRIDNSLRRIENYLHENYIEINDYTGRTANDGINVEIVTVEQDANIKKPVIKETIEPAVLYKGSLRKKSRVIVLSNSQKKEKHSDE